MDFLPGIYAFTGIARLRPMQLMVLHKEFTDAFKNLIDAEGNTITIH